MYCYISHDLLIVHYNALISFNMLMSVVLAIFFIHMVIRNCFFSILQLCNEWIMNPHVLFIRSLDCLLKPSKVGSSVSWHGLDETLTIRILLMSLGHSAHTLPICRYDHMKISRLSWSEAITLQVFKSYAIDPVHTNDLHVIDWDRSFRLTKRWLVFHHTISTTKHSSTPIR